MTGNRPMEPKSSSPDAFAISSNNYAKMRLMGLCPGPRWGRSQRSPQTPRTGFGGASRRGGEWRTGKRREERRWEMAGQGKGPRDCVFPVAFLIFTQVRPWPTPLGRPTCIGVYIGLQV